VRGHTFNSTILPLSVTMAYTVYPVRPFVPEPMQCFKCRRFGHMAKICEAKQRCARCGRDHKTEQCTAKRESLKCVNCGGAHSAAFGGCPKRKEAQKIIAVAQTLQIPRAEAKEKIKKGISFAAAAGATAGNILIQEVKSTPATAPQPAGKAGKQQNETKQHKEKKSGQKSEKLIHILKMLIKAILLIDSTQSVATLKGAAKQALDVLEESSSEEEESGEEESQSDMEVVTEKVKKVDVKKKKKKKKKKNKRPNSLVIPETSTPATEERPTSR
jgi:hypothetical protein